jgi:hypothetical protein
MRRTLTVALTLLAALALSVLSAVVAFAGHPHFVGEPVVTVAGSTVTVTGKEAGLGNEAQIHVTLTADAECVNRGGHNPSAANKTTVSAAGDFPVQNGKAEFSLSATAAFQPNCSPPMSAVFSNVVVEDAANGLRFP